ncbi:MAG: 5-oxoprolinase subunit PxpB [Acidobacteria bacterium]|nr:5-oxoprolinase subunit PxpB [Acidobacteriota bacterium]
MFRYASDQSLYLDAAPEATNLHALLHIPGVVNIHPAYESTLIVFDPELTTHEAIQQAVLTLPPKPPGAQPTRHEIPIHYDGPDLPNVAQLHSISIERVIELHANAEYKVAFLGFVPGFAYLKGLPELLKTPRLSSPRKSVPAGSLGIAGAQTGIYPISTPGGWQLIGRTEVTLFNPANTPMSLLQTGDTVKFIPV